MRIIGGRYKGMEVTADRAGPDWISAHYDYEEKNGESHISSVIIHPRHAEITGDELAALGEPEFAGLWEDLEAREHGERDGTPVFRLRRRSAARRLEDV